MNLKTAKRSKFVLLLVAVLAILVVLFKLYFMTNTQSKIVVFTNDEPDTSDPLKYDSFVNHVVFSSVNSNLVSQYRNGEHTPEIAQSWTVNGDHTEWVFKIRPQFTFSDKSKVTGFVVLSNWLRMAKIMKERHSNSGFFENILGFEKLNNASESIEGLSATEDSIKIRLNKPMPKLLDKISFGLYSIAHPSCYDSDGKWNCNHVNIPTSGLYTIKEWNKKHIVLKKREDYHQFLHHERPIKEIEVIWDKKDHPNLKLDLLMGNELQAPPYEGYKLHGAPPSSILFVRLLSWNNPKSLFSKKENRIEFRNQFYKSLEQNMIMPTRSFFPLIIKGVHELTDPPAKNLKLSGPITIPNYAPQSKLGDAIVSSVLQSAKDFGLNIERKDISFAPLMDELIHKKEETSWDLTRFTTGILASAPLDDVKFMFKSKEGILLPDETGEILNELDKEKVDLQKVNELLWNQGIIWPVAHYSTGLWARPDLDFSEINLVLPPTSFQWIGWKN